MSGESTTTQPPYERVIAVIPKLISRDDVLAMSDEELLSMLIDGIDLCEAAKEAVGVGAENAQLAAAAFFQRHYPELWEADLAERIPGYAEDKAAYEAKQQS
jgi:hypothetical protein